MPIVTHMHYLFIHCLYIYKFIHSIYYKNILQDRFSFKENSPGVVAICTSVLAIVKEKATPPKKHSLSRKHFSWTCILLHSSAQLTYAHTNTCTYCPFFMRKSEMYREKKLQIYLLDEPLFAINQQRGKNGQPVAD